MKIFNISLLVILLCFCVLPINAQIVSSGHSASVNTGQGHPVYLFSDIVTGALSINTHSGTSIEYVWYKYDAGWSQVQSGNSETLNSTLAEGGYRVVVMDNGAPITEYVCWVFEPKILSAEIESSTFTCETLQQGVVNMATKPLTYYDLTSGAAILLDYEYSYAWSSDPVGDIENSTSAQPSIESPYENTSYSVTISAFEGASAITATNDVEAIAVKAEFEFEPSDREYENEVQNLEGLEGSAPMSVSFTGASLGTITDYEWNFVRDEDGYTYAPHLEPNTNFTFEEVGKYSVTLVVSNINSGCVSSVSKEGLITVKEMDIEAPNVFTPDGDGINDVFYVVYHSVESFKMTIVNRWGRKVFSTTNPGDGWDGKINGKKAAEGVYFYYIEAKGYNEGERMELKNALHLIRGK